MNKQFKEMEIKMDTITKKQIVLESKLKGGWIVICSLGAALLGLLGFINTIHDFLVTK